jgi:DNA-binding NarL/FixJ family response regulator
MRKHFRGLATAGRGAAMVRVLVVSHLRFYREGVSDGLSATGRFDSVAASPDAAAASSPPDVVVYDVTDADGLAGVRGLAAHWPGVRVVALGVEQGLEVVPWAEAGAQGFVGRDASMDALGRVVDAAAEGELLCTPGVAAALCRRLAALAQLTRDRPEAGLTFREREIARLMEQGLTNKEIAARLCIQSATVKNHVHSILAKLGARRRGEAAARMRVTHPGLVGASRRDAPAQDAI